MKGKRILGLKFRLYSTPGRFKRTLSVFAQRLLLIVGALVLTSMVLEIAVRVVAPQQLIFLRPDIYIPSPGLGWQKAANLNTTLNTGEGEVHLYTDDKGHRVGPSKAGCESDDYKILGLGDSFAEALQVEHESTMTARLEKGMSEMLGRRVCVKNTGVGGWDPNHYLIQARMELQDSKYDLVVVFIYMPNDVLMSRADYLPPRQPSRRYHLRLPKELSTTEFIDAWLYPVNDFLKKRSHLFIFCRIRFSTLLARVGLTAYYFPNVFMLEQATSRMWGVTADVCADIAMLGRQQGAKVVFLLIPGSYQIDEAEFDRYQRMFKIDPASIDLKQPSRLLIQEFRARGLRGLDATEPLKTAFHSGNTRLYGDVDSHFTPAGHEVVARYLTSVLAERMNDEMP